MMEPGTSGMAGGTFLMNISVTIRYGQHSRMLVLERADNPAALASLRETARQMVDAASPGADVLLQDVLLFRHDYMSPNVLQPFASLAELTNGSLVEVIVVDRNERPTAPHVLDVTSYKTPTFCDYCGEFLIGLVKQGLQCQLCRCNFHKKCAFAGRNNCAKAAAPPGTLPNATANATASPRFALPHTLAVHNFKTLTVCRVCDKMLLGIIKQGFRCRDCKVAVHKKCAHLLASNCELAENVIAPSLERMSVQEGGEEEISPAEDSMIPLARLPGQAASMRVRPSMEGWLVHFVLDDPERRLRHYWILANDAIHMYNEHVDGVGVNPTRVYLVLPLAEVVAVTPYSGEPVDPRFAPHAFELRTITNVVYCCGENLASLAAGAGPASKIMRTATAGRAAATPPPNPAPWIQALRLALQPPASRVDPDNAEPALQFSQLYQVLSEKTLGSGQFGTVYAGVHRQSGREVAVKVISKERFSKRSACAESLRSEVGILQSISHPGIVRLESMFETNDKIFVVMEKLNGDMLEMILSQATGRLSERITKFLLIQILSALRYLHNKGIAHCDLKPENVLLSQQHTAFPQTKLCDFGYARFIGEQQFRKTIVGTPAYLPPEVLQKRGYNRSLDMWSVGVIIYVTLSGTFPFNDGEEVSEQIENAAFMFPSDSWASVSRDAIDLIQRLLRVQIDDRLNIDECIEHRWLQSSELFDDIRELEARIGEAYLTAAGSLPGTPCSDGGNSLI